MKKLVFSFLFVFPSLAHAEVATYLEPLALINGLGGRIEMDAGLPFSLGLLARKSLWGSAVSKLSDKRNSSSNTEISLSAITFLSKQDDSWFYGPAIGYWKKQSVSYIKESDKERKKQYSDYRIASSYDGPVAQFTAGKRWVWSSNVSLRIAGGAGYWFRKGSLNLPPELPSQIKKPLVLTDKVTAFALNSEISVGYLW